MTLAEYLESTGESLVSLSRRAGVSRPTLLRVKRMAPCQTRILDKIASATGLTREGLLPSDSPPKKKNPRAA